MLLVKLGINSTRDVWKFCQIRQAAVQTSLVLLIPNCTCQRMITYTNSGVSLCFVNRNCLFIISKY